MPTLKKMLAEAAVAEGRRARDLRVPGRWGSKSDEDGVYSAKADGDAIVIVDLCSGFAHTIAAEDVPRSRDGVPLDVSELRIEHNFTAERARLVGDCSDDSFLLITLGGFGRKGKRAAAMQVIAAEAVASKEAGASEGSSDALVVSGGAGRVDVSSKSRGVKRLALPPRELCVRGGFRAEASRHRERCAC